MARSEASSTKEGGDDNVQTLSPFSMLQSGSSDDFDSSSTTSTSFALLGVNLMRFKGGSHLGDDSFSCLRLHLVDFLDLFFFLVEGGSCDRTLSPILPTIDSTF